MRKLLFSVLFFVSVFCFSQSVHDKIVAQFTDYNQLILDAKYEEAVDRYADENIFEILPKSQLVTTMREVMTSDQYDIKFRLPTNIEAEKDLLKKKGRSYAILNYRQLLQMRFKGEDALGKDEALPFLALEFGEENVAYDEETGFFKIQLSKKAVASSEDLEQWKFTVAEKDQLDLLQKFLPQQVIKRLNL